MVMYCGIHSLTKRPSQWVRMRGAAELHSHKAPWQYFVAEIVQVLDVLFFQFVCLFSFPLVYLFLNFPASCVCA